ncbi:hypothetical protein V8687_20205 [Shewanella baltica]|uniref:hypothetical protein n=1 Tax=Shewanella baltica TaxID=62322 RepID=UPI0030CD5AE8
MVNTRNVSRYAGNPPSSIEESRKIPGGPIYAAHDVKELLSIGSSALVAWTEKCKRDLKDESLDLDDVVELMKTCFHQRGEFLGSEWCQQSTNGPWVACDAYRVFHKMWIEHAYKEMDFEFYIKFAIGITGKIVMTISCHRPS